MIGDIDTCDSFCDIVRSARGRFIRTIFVGSRRNVLGIHLPTSSQGEGAHRAPVPGDRKHKIIRDDAGEAFPSVTRCRSHDSP